MSEAPVISTRRDEVERYREDGVIRLRGAFRDWAEPLREAIGGEPALAD